MTRRGMTSRLRQMIECGEYVIDERAVAQAILDRLRARESGVFVSAQLLQDPASGSDQHGAGSLGDGA